METFPLDPLDFFAPPAPAVNGARSSTYLLLFVAMIALLVVVWWCWESPRPPVAKQALR